jgi:cytochrome c55X
MKLYVGIIAVALSAMAAAWQATRAEPDEQVEVQLADKGKSLYVRHCARCHGFNLVTPGTVAYDLRLFPRDGKARFVQSVSEGKNGRMPKWGDVLNGDDIDQLWAYVRTGGKQ